MGSFTIYDTQGRQVEPAVDGQRRADGRLAEHIDNSVDLYFDPDAGRIVAYVRAKAPVVSGDRAAHYHAEYVADDGEDPLRGLITRLQALEGREEGSAWTFLRDRDRFNIVWWLDELEDPSIVDTGLAPLDQFVVERLLGEGQELGFGVGSYHGVATAVAHFHRSPGPTPSIGVSSGGRIAPIRSVDLVFAPGEYDGIVPLPDGTRDVVRSRRQNISEDVRELYEQRVLAAVDDLAETDELTALQRHRDITALETYITSLWGAETEHVDLRCEPSERVARIATTLRQGGATDDLPDPKTMLDDSGRSAVRDRLLDRLETERERLEDEMPDRVRGEFDAALDDLLDYEVTAVNGSLARLIDLFDGHRESLPDSLPAPAHRVESRLRELEENDTLTPRQRNEIREEVEDDLERTRETLKEGKREKFLTQFDRCLDRFDLTDVRAEDDIVSRLRRVVNDHETVTPESELVRRFHTVVSDVASSEIFSEGERRAIRSEFIDRLETRLDTLRTERERSLESRLESQVAELTQRSDGEELAEVYRRLWLAKQLCSTDPTQRIDHPDLQRFGELVRELNQDELVPQDRASELRERFEADIADELVRIEEDKQEEVRSRIADELDRVVSQVSEESGHEETLRLLGELERYLEGEGTRPPDPRFEQVCSLIDRIGRSNDGHDVEILDRSDRRELRGAIRATITDHETAIREDRKRQFVEAFDSLVGSLLEHPGISSRTRLELFDRIEAYLEKHPGSVAGELDGIDVEVTPEHHGEIAELYGEITDYLEHSRSNRVETILTRDQRRQLRKEHYPDVIDDALESARSSFRDDVRQRLETEIRSEILDIERYDGTSVDRLDRDIEFLEGVETELRDGPGGYARRGSTDVMDLIGDIKGRGLLPPDDRDGIRTELRAVVEELLERRRARKEELRIGAFRDEVDRIVTADFTPHERLQALRQLETLLEHGEIGAGMQNQYLSDPDSLLEKRGSLSNDDVSEITDRIANAREPAAERFIGTVRQGVEQQLRQHVENADSGVNVDQGLRSFGQHVSSGSTFDPHHQHLGEAKRQFAVARELNDLSALPDSSFQVLKERIHRTTESFRDGSSGRFTRLRRVPRRCLRRAKRSVNSIDRSTVAVVLVALLVGVALGALAAGLVWR